MDCYNKIIGLSRKTATCYPSKPTADTSLSGLWIDEAEPLKNISGALSSENSTVWDVMTEARANAISTFVSDTNIGLLEEKELKRGVWNGAIGDGIARERLQVGNNYAFVRMYADRVKDGYLSITNIRPLFNESGTFTLMIYNNLEELVGTYTLNKNQNNTVSINLPLWNEYLTNLEYYFIYSLDGNNPRNNKLWCKCSGVPMIFNLNNCDFKRRVSDRFGWANWVMVGGSSCNTLEPWLSTSGNDYAMGLLFDVDIRCNASNLLCRHLDFTYNALAMPIAYAIFYKTVELILAKTLTNMELRREAEMNNEMNQKFMILYKEKYDELLKKIISEADLKMNDCLKCRDKIQNFKLLS
jgi:hypothetical protein